MRGVLWGPIIWRAVLTTLITGTFSITSALERTLPNVDVAKLGADATGHGDSTAALQKALASLADGGTLHIPAGVYRIERQLATVRGNVTIEGEGEKTIIEQLSDMSNGNGLNIRHDGVTIRNLKIRSVQRLRDYGAGVLIRNPETRKGDVKIIQNASITNVVIEGFRYGIAGSLLKNLRLEQNRIMVGTKAFEAKQRGSCIEVSGDDMVIRDNVLGTLEGAVAEHNIYIAGGAGKSETRCNIQILGNTCGGKKRSCGIQAYNASWNNLRIEMNRINMAGTGMHGIFIGFHAGGSPMVQDIHIIGNTIENVSSPSVNSGNGITLFTYSARQIVIANNTIRNTSNAAIRFIPANKGTGVDGFTIRENIFENWSVGNKGIFPAVLFHSLKGSPVMANGVVERNIYRPGSASTEKVKLNNRDKTRYRNVKILDQ